MKMLKKIVLNMLALCTAMSALPLSARAEGPDENIVAGLPYTVETGIDISHSYGLSGGETDPALGLLTDGKYSPGQWYTADDVHHFYRGHTRSVIFELPEEKAVTGFSASIIHMPHDGLPMPPSFDLYVSLDGEDYRLAYSYDATHLNGATVPTKRLIKAENMGSFRAKFVKLTFRCEVAVYMDELEIYGHTPDGSETLPEKQPEKEYINKYDEGVEGCKDIVLLYCGYTERYSEDFVNNSYEKLLPYFGYIGKDGEILDTFFDSFMFSALDGACPSGGNLDPSNGKQATMSDWLYFLDSIFSEEYNCGAIERVMDDVKAATGKSDAKVSLVINVPYPTLGNTPFGDIDGDGKVEYCRTREDQFAIYRWFFDRVEEKMAERGYKNIRLGGYYWWSERLDCEKEEEEVAFIRDFADEIHRRGSKLFWIPLLFANGFDRVPEMGFDSAMMQPNFSFLDYTTEECFGEINDVLYKNGLGIEIEIHWSAANKAEYLQRYYSYLNACKALGLDKGVAHSYYQNAGPGTYYGFAYSNESKLRQVYDDTYAFVKGEYEIHKITLSARERSTTEGKAVRSAVLAGGGYDTSTLGMWEWVITSAPSHGTATIDRDGLYCYTPEDGFTGTDTFKVQMRSVYAASDELEISIEVKPNETAASDAPEAPSDDAPTSDDGKKLLVGLIAGIAAALSVISAALILLHRKKK